MSGGRFRKKGRDQGDAEDQGVTKARILIFVADNWIDREGPNYDDVEEHLRNTSNIKARSGIYKHLSELVEQGYLVAGTDLDGRTYYKLKYNFEYFRRTYNYIYGAGCANDFLNTKYYCRQIESSQFKAKLVINALKEVVLNLFDYIKTKGGYKEIQKEMAKKSELYRDFHAMFDDLHSTDDAWMLTNGRKPQNKYSEGMLEILRYLHTYDVDQLYMAIERDMGLDGPAMVFNRFFSEEDKSTILDTLRASPSAVDRVINQTGYEPAQLIATMIRFFMSAMLSDESKRKIIAGLVRNSKTMDQETASASMDQLFDFSNIISESPIVTSLRTAFNEDYQNGMLANNEYSLRMVKQLYTPKIKG